MANLVLDALTFCGLALFVLVLGFIPTVHHLMGKKKLDQEQELEKYTKTEKD